MNERDGRFEVGRALAWLGLIFLALLFALLLWFGGRILLLVFAGILMGVILRVPMAYLIRRFRVPDRVAYAVVLFSLLALMVGFGFLVGPRVLTQAGEFSEQLPGFIDDARSFLEERPWGSWLVDLVEDGGQGAGGGQGGGGGAQLAAGIGGAARSVGSTLAHLVFVLVLALFLALDPLLYRRGVVRLFPRRAQQRAMEVVDELGRTLRAWLVGQLTLMLLTGLLTGIGLVIVGIPLALGLAFFVGLMEFIPLVGPIVGFVPIVIMASTQGMGALLSVAILYLVIQQIEGNILTPLVQQRVVSLPPALTVSAVFLGGALFGPLGVILGTPLIAVLFVLTKMLYVHDVLGQSVEVPGRREPA